MVGAEHHICIDRRGEARDRNERSGRRWLGESDKMGKGGPGSDRACDRISILRLIRVGSELPMWRPGDTLRMRIKAG